jgi:sec-independent protein translocase protein TatB
MLDLGLSKMALISVVALVVLGPERLPRVARTAGALFSRAQRYINDVKAEVSREIELDALRSMKSEVEQAARNVQTTVHEHERMIGDTVRAQTSAINGAWQGNATDVEAVPYEPPAPGPVAAYPAAAAGLPKRRNWRVRQGAQPLWYKRANVRRTYVQSGAARVARHRPASLRRPVSFF